MTGYVTLYTIVYLINKHALNSLKWRLKMEDLGAKLELDLYNIIEDLRGNIK